MRIPKTNTAPPPESRAQSRLRKCLSEWNQFPYPAGTSGERPSSGPRISALGVPISGYAHPLAGSSPQLAVTSSGLAVGLLLSAAVAVGVSRFLFGVSALDPYAFAAAALLLAGVTAGASYIPSARAARSDPMAALRQE
jgi:hypothetical protein